MKQAMPTLLYLLLAIGSTNLASHAVAQTSPQMSIRDALPPTGSRVRRNAANSTLIPINLTYEELSAADKAKFRGSYTQLPEEDEPPFPKAGLKSLIEPLTQLQQKMLVEGNLLLIATVDPNGKVQKVNAVEYPTPEMAKFASTVLMLTEFKPAACGRQPCSMEFPLRIQFRLQ